MRTDCVMSHMKGVSEGVAELQKLGPETAVAVKVRYLL